MTKPCILAFVCAACVVDVGGAPAPPQPTGEPDPIQTCNDPRYGDGVCATDLACEVPDIDCFQTFADDAAAALWFAGRDDENRTLLPPSDPRFVQLRALLDTGWAAFVKARPVGKLAERHVALVVIDDPSVNGFTSGVAGKQVVAVMVHSGLLAAPFDEDGRLGILLHELQHIVGLHTVPGVDDAMKRHYVASGAEPIGRFQADDPIVRDAMEGWMNMAADVGPYSHVELGGFPYKGILWGMIDLLVDRWMESNAARCGSAEQQIRSLRDDLADARDPLDERLTMIDLSRVEQRADTAIATLRDQCMQNVPLTFVEVLADLLGEPEQEIANSLSARDRSIVAGKQVVTAIAALVSDRRSTMRTLERALPQQRPWSAARYFTDEEDADDVAVIVLRAAGRDPNAYAAALESAVAKRGADAATRCAALLDAGAVPPYGVDLLDAHHASCWRAFHAAQIAKLDPRKSRRAPAVVVERSTALVGLPKPRPPELVIQH